MNVIDKSPKLAETSLPGMFVITAAQYRDPRGVFMETYNERVMKELGLPTHWCQDNFSISKQNVVRGLHYQISHPQGKLVRVLAGAVLDIAVDLRRSSPTFGQHALFELSADNGVMLWIPPGFAHGFLTLTEQAAFTYKVTDYYFAAGERTISWNDPELDIAWPIPEELAIISDKDRAGTSFSSAETFA